MQTNNRNLWLRWSVAAFFCGGLQLSAEDVTRPSIVGSRLERKYTFDQTNYNLKLGPVTFRASAGLRVEFNDNIGLNENHKESDLILRPQVSLAGLWPVTPFNAVNLSATFSYSKYLNHSEYDDVGDSLSIAPDSELTYDIFLGHFTLNLHDRFSVDQNPYGGFASGRKDRDRQNFGQFMNSAGAGLIWDANKFLVLTLSYDHTNAIATKSTYRFSDYSQDQLSFLLRQVLSRQLAVGIEASASSTAYKTGDKADGSPYHAGVFIDAQFTEYTRLRLAAGYQGINFSGSSAATVEIDPEDKTLYDSLRNQRIAGEDQHTFYGNAEFVNRLSKYFSQRISFGREASLAVTAQSVELVYVRYSADWIVNSLITLNLQLFYEDGSESGALQPEDFTRTGGGFNTSFALGPKLNAEIGYNFTRKNSNLTLESYTQNVVYLGLNYTF